MKRDDTAAIYHELSGRYGQTMTMQDACRELNFKKPETVKKVMPPGWIGAKGGLRIKPISLPARSQTWRCISLNKEKQHGKEIHFDR